MEPRLLRIRQLTRSHLLSHALDGSTLRLTYDGAAADELDRLVALERQCCAFLEFHLARTGDAVELVIVAPQQDGADARWLFSHFISEASTPVLGSSCACRGQA
jgi:hypothetical protein